MTIRRYIVRGRSIDGTVYAVQGHYVTGWTLSRRQASHMTARQAQEFIADERVRNRRRELDDKVGHLAIIPAALSLRSYAARQKPLFAAASSATVHCFTYTGDAYDACQCRDEIKTGDALLIPEEGVVGLAWAWPLAVTVAAGEFHTISDEDGATARVLADAKISPDQVRAAVALAMERGLAVRDEFRPYAPEGV